MNKTEKLKWWGWGLEGQEYRLPDPENFWSFLESTLGPLKPCPRVGSLSDIPVAPSRLTQADVATLTELFGDSGVTFDQADRLVHAVGKSYPDLVRIRQGQLLAIPDGVVFPEQEEQILAVLEAAAKRNWAVIPFGGGTSVVGGVEPSSQDRPVLTLNLQRMNRVLDIDSTSNTARIQSGILGPELETVLNAMGFTLGHFPQSFEFSTLGGWIATRSAGQNSTKYGKIEDMVVSLRMVTPGGVLESPVVPAEAVGPSMLQCLVGSEGTLGVITQAVVRLHPVPQHRDFSAYLFPDFATGLSAVRNLLQSEICPAVLRLSDPDETAVAVLLSQSPHPSFKERLGRWYVRARGLDLGRGAMLVLVFEGTRNLVSAARREAKHFLRSAIPLGSHPARKWMKSRFRHPYLRDDLLDRSVMVDTVETAAPWERLPNLYDGVRKSLSAAILETAPGALVLGHLSHAYRDGASLYFTYLARQQTGLELEQWQAAKKAATEAILKYDGALSHHHGIGSMHKAWMRPYLGSEGLKLLEHLKEKLDPNNILNPGKLVGG
ncbi:MAG: FAD-binding oxidoreductase [Deltaproteobacteria bacterium]|nr:MAG: FAD-binding oxidoreductase [Deltaproteobacteria bacterium]